VSEVIPARIRRQKLKLIVLFLATTVISIIPQKGKCDGQNKRPSRQSAIIYQQKQSKKQIAFDLAVKGMQNRGSRAGPDGFPKVQLITYLLATVIPGPECGHRRAGSEQDGRERSHTVTHCHVTSTSALVIGSRRCDLLYPLILHHSPWFRLRSGG
jgi:hypothetical protein